MIRTIDMTKMSPEIKLPQTESSSLPPSLALTFLFPWYFSPLPSSILLIIGVSSSEGFIPSVWSDAEMVATSNFVLHVFEEIQLDLNELNLINCCTLNLTALHHTNMILLLTWIYLKLKEDYNDVFIKRSCS